MITKTVDAPARMGRRSEVLEMLSDVPDDLSDTTVRFESSGSLASTSFVDELIAEVVIRRRARALVFVGPSDYLRSLAMRSATDFAVVDQITFD